MTEKEIKEKAAAFIEEFGLDELDTDAFVQGALWAQSKTRLQFNEIVSQALKDAYAHILSNIKGKGADRMLIDLFKANMLFAGKDEAEHKEILSRLNSIKLSIMAHPDYAMQDTGEFHDNISTIEEIERIVKNSRLNPVSKPLDFDKCPLCRSKRVERTSILIRGSYVYECLECCEQFSN